MEKEISYSELARRVGDCILNNEIMNTEEGFWELVNGDDTYCYAHETKKECEEREEDCRHESYDIYQNYIITESGADYLKRNTNEVVYYNEKLNMYLWGITHFGTSWDEVFTTINEAE